MGRFLNADALVSTGGLLGNNMFAYCLNNPITLIDYSGMLPLSRTSLNQCSTYDPLYGTLYINDQDDETVADKPIGIATVSHGGCGAVATYNALVAMGVPITFEDVLDYYNSNFFRLNLGGLAGMMPQTVNDYFESQGYGVIMTDDVDLIDAFSKTADACILWYLFTTDDGFGGHFVQYTSTATGYVGHNTSASYGITVFDSPSEYGYRNNRFYCVGIFIYK